MGLNLNIHESGKKYEYKLLYWLRKYGFNAVRIPSSATGKQPLPDLFAVKNGVLYAFEVKSSSNGIIRVEEHQIKKLFEFCDMFRSIVPENQCLKYVVVFWKYNRESPCFYIIPKLNKYTIEEDMYECEKI